MPAVRSLYDILNVSPEAEPVVIEAAYKALMKRYHPDQADETAPVSKDVAEINKAFAVLKDPAKRSEYDHRLWTKQQSIRLAELQALEPRRPARLFGATGWALAIILGGVVAVMTMARDFNPPVPTAVRAAAAVEQSKRVAPERAAAIKAAAAEEKVDYPSAELILARARKDVSPARRPVAAPLAARAPKAAAQRRERPPVRRAPSKPREPAAKSDFLEREGYIY
jgi:curved DNA-binding protein CbpA